MKLCMAFFAAGAFIKGADDVRAFVQGSFYGNARFDGGKAAYLFTLRNP